MTIARQDAYVEKPDVWAKLAAPLNATDLAWRQDGKPTARDGKFLARFVVYVEAGTVRDRLDSVCPGEWDLTLELLPSSDVVSRDGEVTGRVCSFKARLQILGVIRENVGSGSDYKSAATDAFKRAAVRFGIGSELYDFEQNWVEVDSDSKYAKPVEDPQKAYERRHGSGAKVSGPSPDNPAPGVAAGGVPAPAKRTAGEKTMPFGKTKGKTLNSLSDTELERTAEWCRSTDAVKFKDLIADIETVLDARADTRPVASNAGVGADRDSYPDALRDDDSDLPF